MRPIYFVLAILAAITWMGSIGVSLQQTSAIIDNWKEEFRVLTDDFEDAVSNATDQERVNLEGIQQLVDNYKTNLTKIFKGSENSTAIN